ncbi:24855_t:CDS:2 [Gigaspora margarita]|uniref:24855_t:CDS:1 n=1 Tax=Gigaspora margarita TaxID=4874 RepID=A0ABN7ULB3_GIGMA|nr:24855_t:CDS:2 [Gigaspora margarita]
MPCKIQDAEIFRCVNVKSEGFVRCSCQNRNNIKHDKSSEIKAHGADIVTNKYKVSTYYQRFIRLSNTDRNYKVDYCNISRKINMLVNISSDKI